MKIKSDEGIDDDETSKINRMPLQLGSFISNNSKRIMNHFSKLLDGIKPKSVHYKDTN